MNNLGPRYTGSAAHQKFTSFLDDGFAAAGLAVEHIKHTSLVRWDPRTISLATGGGEPLPIASVARYSASTGPAGVLAPLCYCGRAEGPSGFTASLFPDQHAEVSIPAGVAGKIALIEVTATAWPFDKMFPNRVRALQDPEHAGPLPPVQSTIPAYGAARLPERLEQQLKSAGAVGVVYAWVNVVDADAHGQLKGGTAALPSVWVGPTAGKRLQALAESGQPVRLTVDADLVRDVPTATTIATLPGSSDEGLTLWTHTDGMNAIEENGGVAILNLVRAFARLPKSQRRKTFVCVLSEGHFAEQYLPTSGWIKERPDIVAKASAGMAIEHLGCREWVADPQRGTYVGNGKPDFAFAFCPTSPLPDVMRDSLAGQRRGRTVVIDTEEHAFSPGLSAYRVGKIPTVGYISAPPYLLAEAGDGHIDKLDPAQFYEQLKTLARALGRLDAMPSAQLRPA